MKLREGRESDMEGRESVIRYNDGISVDRGDDGGIYRLKNSGLYN